MSHRDVHAELDALRREVDRLAADLEAAQARAALLESLAHEDPLTGLLNRRGFCRDLARALAYGQRYGASIAILLADLDDFKGINDAYGHHAGDAALAHVAALLRGHVRASDSAARIGGDEFALILWNADEAAARQKARALEDLVSGAPLAIEGLDLMLRVSIGAAIPDSAEGAEAALARADRAMYARKRGRRTVGPGS